MAPLQPSCNTEVVTKHKPVVYSKTLSLHTVGVLVPALAFDVEEPFDCSIF